MHSFGMHQKYGRSVSFVMCYEIDDNNHEMINYINQEIAASVIIISWMDYIYGNSLIPQLLFIKW